MLGLACSLLSVFRYFSLCFDFSSFPCASVFCRFAMNCFASSGLLMISAALARFSWIRAICFLKFSCSLGYFFRVSRALVNLSGVVSVSICVANIAPRSDGSSLPLFLSAVSVIVTIFVLKFGLISRKY